MINLQDFDKLKVVNILDGLSDAHDESSDEYQALLVAIAAVFFVGLPESHERFRTYLTNLDRKPTEEEKAAYRIMGYALGADNDNEP